MSNTAARPVLKRNYLSRLANDNEERRSIRRECYFLARACFMTKGMRGAREVLVEVLDISEHGVRLFCKRAQEVPHHFYMFVGNYQHGIGCAVVGRDEDLICCEFLKPESLSVIDFLAGVGNPQSTLFEIRHPLFA